VQTDRPAWRSRAWPGAAIVLAAVTVVLLAGGADAPVAGWAVLLVAAAVTATVLGWALHRTSVQRRRYEGELAAWAAERAARDERLRIARDLHDLVSHGLGLITVRAAAARCVTGPDGVTERANALADVERVSRETTTELRRMLTVLRTSGPASLRPAETLVDLPAIVRAANESGLSATLGIDDLGNVSPGAQLTICAVVREALHNTLRHAGPTSARISIHRERGTIAVTVSDAGARAGWQPQPGAGHGLSGLRERITVLGGDLRAGTAGDGYQLTAHIPDQDQR
jgi:two-component system sensor histidine kinase DesK